MALRDVLAKFGFDIDDTKLSAAIKKTDDFTAKVVAIGERFAGGNVLGSLKEMISDLKDKAGEIRGTAMQLGLTNHEFQKLQYQSGLSSETLANTFRVLQKNIAGAAGTAKGAVSGIDDLDSALDGALGAKAATEQFKALKISLKDAEGNAKAPIEVFGELASKIGDIEDPSQRTAIAMKIFGRQGTALLPFFRKGGQELKDLADQFENLGGGLSDKAIKGLTENGKATKRLNLAMLSLKSAIAEQVVPWFTKQVEASTKVVSWILKAIKGTELLKAGLIVIAGAMAFQARAAIAAGLKTALAYAPVILTMAAIILLIDEVITTFKGGDTLIARGGKAWLEWLSNSKASAEVNNDVWHQFVSDIKATDWANIFGDAWDYWSHQLTEGLSQAGYVLVKFFVDAYESATDWTSRIWHAIIDGLVGGLDSGWSFVKEAVLRLGKNMKDTFADFWQAHSPSQVMRKDVKVMLGGGVVEGWKDSYDEIEKAATEAYSAAKLPSGDYTPQFFGSGSSPGSVSRSASLDQKNYINIQVTGGPGGQGIADAIRDSLPQPLNDSKRAALSALETVFDDGS